MDYHWPVARLIAFVLFVIAAVYCIFAATPEINVALAIIAAGLAAHECE